MSVEFELARLRKLLRKQKKPARLIQIKNGKPQLVKERSPQEAHLDDVPPLSTEDAVLLRRPENQAEEEYADFLIERQKEAIKAAKFARLAAGKVNPICGSGGAKEPAGVMRLGPGRRQRGSGIRES